MAVAGFAAFSDPQKAHEVSNEVRRTIKSLKECQEQANLYNARERLFEMPITGRFYICMIFSQKFDSNFI